MMQRRFSANGDERHSESPSALRAGLLECGREVALIGAEERSHADNVNLPVGIGNDTVHEIKRKAMIHIYTHTKFNNEFQTDVLAP